MSHDYGSISGYGIKIGKFDEQKMFDILSKSNLVKDYLAENNLEMNIDNYKEILEDYNMIFNRSGYLVAFLDTLTDLKITYQQFFIEEDCETGCFYLLYIPDTFPKKAVKQEDIDAIFYKVMDMVGMDEVIFYQNIHWFE